MVVVVVVVFCRYIYEIYRRAVITRCCVFVYVVLSVGSMWNGGVVDVKD